MKKLISILCGVLLILFLYMSSFTNASISSTKLDIESSTFGDHITGESDAPYRILAYSWNETVALYPNTLQGSITLTVGDISSNYSLNAVIILQLIFTEKEGRNQYSTYVWDILLANFSLSPNKTLNNQLQEIDYTGTTSYVLDNETVIPKASNGYLYEIDKEAFVKTTIFLFFEQSNHTVEWSSSLSIDGEITINTDPELGEEMLRRENSITRLNLTKNVSWFHIYDLIVILPLMLKMYKKHKMLAFC